MHEIDRIFIKYPFFGSRKIAAYLPQSGFSTGRHRVRRLMGIMGLQAIYKGLNTSKSHPQHPIYPYLLRKLSITRANHVWCSYITYIPDKNGSLYLVAIMDWATRKVLSWRLSNTLDASFCVETLKNAIAKFGKPEIINTDQGSQYTGAEWIKTLTSADIKISMEWQRPLFGQYIDRAALALFETRGNLPVRNNKRLSSQNDHQRMDEFLQYRTTTHYLQNSRQAFFAGENKNRLD